MKRYEAKRAVIIGGTSGMGLATAKMLRDGGARVLVTGRSQAGLDSAQIELGKDALVVASDARSLADLDALGTRVKVEFDTLDLLFFNAGFSIPTRLESVTEAIYDEMFNLNAKGPLFAVQKLAPLMSKNEIAATGERIFCDWSRQAVAGLTPSGERIAPVRRGKTPSDRQRSWPKIGRSFSVQTETHSMNIRSKRTSLLPKYN